MLCPVANAREAVKRGFPFSSGVKWPLPYLGAAHWQIAWGGHCPRDADASAGRVWLNRQSCECVRRYSPGHARLGVFGASRADLNLAASLAGVCCIILKY